MVYQADQGEEYRLSGGGFDDCGFAYTCGVEIDVGAFFGGFFLDVEI